MVGISFDSQDQQTRKEVGRIDRKGNSLNVEEIKLALRKLSHTQKGLKTKINTVVNSLNWKEDFSFLMSEITPDKWKVLQVMPYDRDSNELLISDAQFNYFVSRHTGKGLPIYPESNCGMTESYMMIDPKGRFYQNSKGMSGYFYSSCINDVGVEKALSQINFNSDTFIARYSRIKRVIAVGEGALK
jgi:radical S-adenosyl methionine domain-containing protein 2